MPASIIPLKGSLDEKFKQEFRDWLCDRTYAFGACELRTNPAEARFEGLEIIDSRVFVVDWTRRRRKENLFPAAAWRQEVAGSKGPARG